MEPTGDELAGVVDLFGALTRAELRAALAELAFKRGEDHESEAFEADVAAAVDSYHLVPVEDTGAAAELLVAGPAAFPTLPEGGADLPHIMDAPDRTVEDATRAAAAESRFRADAAAAVEAGDDDRVAALLDVSYELEAWGPVDLGGARERLDAALGVGGDGTN